VTGFFEQVGAFEQKLPLFAPFFGGVQFGHLLDDRILKTGKHEGGSEAKK
jgi:hypothetical protein